MQTIPTPSPKGYIALQDDGRYLVYNRQSSIFVGERDELQRNIVFLDWILQRQDADGRIEDLVAKGPFVLEVIGSTITRTQKYTDGSSLRIQYYVPDTGPIKVTIRRTAGRRGTFRPIMRISGLVDENTGEPLVFNHDAQNKRFRFMLPNHLGNREIEWNWSDVTATLTESVQQSIHGIWTFEQIYPAKLMAKDESESFDPSTVTTTAGQYSTAYGQGSHLVRDRYGKLVYIGGNTNVVWGYCNSPPSGSWTSEDLGATYVLTATAAERIAVLHSNEWGVGKPISIGSGGAGRNFNAGSYIIGYGSKFTVDLAAKLYEIRAFLRRVGSPTGTIYAKLYSDSGGVPSTELASGSLDVSTLPSGTYHEWVRFTLTTPYSLASGTTYHLTIEYANADTSNYVSIAYSGGLTGDGERQKNGDDENAIDSYDNTYWDYSRFGQRRTIPAGATVKQFTFQVAMLTGSHSGTGYGRIRLVSDDSVVATSSDTYNMGTLPLGTNNLVFNFDQYFASATEVRILFEWSTPDNEYYYTTNTDKLTGYATMWDGSYTNYTARDTLCRIKIAYSATWTSNSDKYSLSPMLDAIMFAWINGSDDLNVAILVPSRNGSNNITGKTISSITTILSVDDTCRRPSLWQIMHGQIAIIWGDNSTGGGKHGRVYTCKAAFASPPTYTSWGEGAGGTNLISTDYSGAHTIHTPTFAQRTNSGTGQYDGYAFWTIAADATLEKKCKLTYNPTTVYWGWGSEAATTVDLPAKPVSSAYESTTGLILYASNTEAAGTTIPCGSISTSDVDSSIGPSGLTSLTRSQISICTVGSDIYLWDVISSNIYYIKRSGGSWGSETQFTTTNNENYPSASLVTAGRIDIVWTHYVTTGDWDVYYDYITLALSWTGTESLGVGDVMGPKPVSKLLVETVQLPYLLGFYTAKAAFTEAISLAEILQTLKATVQNIYETMAVADAISKLTSKNLTEQSRALDSLTKQLSKLLTETETLSYLLKFTPNKVLTEQGTVIDYIGPKQASKLLTETENLTYLLQLYTSKAPFTEQLILYDAVPKTPSKLLTEQEALTDVLGKVISKLLTEQPTLYDTLTKTPTKLLTEIENLTYILQFNTSKMLTEIDILSDLVKFMPSKAITEQETLIDAMGPKTISHVLTETEILSYILGFALSRAPFTEQLTLYDALVKTPSKLLTETEILSFMLQFYISRAAFTETIATSDTLTKEPRKVLTELASLTEIVSFVKSVVQTLYENLILTDTVAKQPSKTLFETITSEIAARILALKVLEETVSLTEVMGPKPVSKLLIEPINISEVLKKDSTKLLEEPHLIGDYLILEARKLLEEIIAIADFVSTAVPGLILYEALSIAEALLKEPRKILEEPISIADYVSASLWAGQVIYESLALADQLIKRPSKVFEETITLPYLRLMMPQMPYTEQLSLYEILMKAPAKVLIDQETLIDTLGPSSISKALYETKVITDLLTKTPTTIRTEILSTADLMRWLPSKSMLEPIALSEALLKGPTRTLYETKTVSDLVSFTVSRSFIETVSLIDLVANSPSSRFYETVSLIEILRKSPSKLLTETTSILDYLSLVTSYLQQLLEQIGVADALRKLASTTTQEQISLIDTRQLAALTTKLEQIRLGDLSSILPYKLFQEQLALTDLKIFTTTKLLYEPLSTSDILTKGFSGILYDTISLAEILIKNPSKLIEETISLADYVSTFIAIMIDLYETLNISDLLLKEPWKIITEPIILQPFWPPKILTLYETLGVIPFFDEDAMWHWKITIMQQKIAWLEEEIAKKKAHFRI